MFINPGSAVITDCGISVILDGSEKELVYQWGEIDCVEYDDNFLYFRGCEKRNDYTPLHIRHFSNNLKASMVRKYGQILAKMFTNVATAVPRTTSIATNTLVKEEATVKNTEVSTEEPQKKLKIQHAKSKKEINDPLHNAVKTQNAKQEKTQKGNDSQQIEKLLNELKACIEKSSEIENGHTQQGYLKETNEFAKIRENVRALLERYRQVRKICEISDKWNSESIEFLGKRFTDDCFTLIIVGKVSSGKSTFINALLDCNDLLPTGHNQTTCGITHIEWGDEPEAEITYGDGRVDKIYGPQLKTEIKSLVALPEKYRHLPVNKIDGMIKIGWSFDQIWETHKDLEEETLCPSIDKNLLEEYVTNRKVGDIPTNVGIKYPFQKALKGWRIIDTPGTGAKGGIEDETRNLLAEQKEDGKRKVDAIIFLQDGSKTLDESESIKFMKELLEKNMSKADRSRLFFVLTRSSSLEFIKYKESNLDTIQKYYGNYIKDVTYADGFLQSFLSELKSTDVDLKNYNYIEKFDSWDKNDWDRILEILDRAKRSVEQEQKSFNNENMIEKLREWSNFEQVAEKINKFTQSEKKESLKEFFRLIKYDYEHFRQQLLKNEKLVKGGLDDINKEIEDVQNKRRDYNQTMKKLDNITTIDEINGNFSFMDSVNKEIDELYTESEIRTYVTNLFDRVQEAERHLFENIREKFSTYLSGDDLNDPVVKSLDFKEIERQAKAMSREQYVVSPEQIKHHSSSPDEKIPAKYGHRTDPVKKLRNFKALVLSRVNKEYETLLGQIGEKIDNTQNRISIELDQKTKEEENRLKGLIDQQKDKVKFKEINDKKLEAVRLSLNELKNKNIYYECQG